MSATHTTQLPLISIGTAVPPAVAKAVKELAAKYPKYIIRQYCYKCGRLTQSALFRTVCSNGASLVYWFCLDGYHRSERGGKNLPHPQLKATVGIAIEEIPVYYNNAETLCEVMGCQELGYESHHWAPRGVFGSDANLWPQSNLCKKHHDEWHKRVHDGHGPWDNALEDPWEVAR